MDTWLAKCEACGSAYEVKASNEGEAIDKAEKAHEEDHGKRMMHRCDMGPFITVAFNLTHPTHPCAPSEW